MIVHGDRDDLIPAASGRALAEARPAGTTFDLVPGDHMSILGREDVTWEPRFAAMMGPTCRRDGGGHPARRSAPPHARTVLRTPVLA